MRIAVLGATGAVGGLLVEEALRRGAEVTALARDPRRVPARPGLHVVAADVFDAASISRAVRGSDVLVSGLGVRGGTQGQGVRGGAQGPGVRGGTQGPGVRGGTRGTLTAGAEAVAAAGVPRIIWLGALGTGPSAARAGLLTRSLLWLAMRAELPDKVAADRTVLDAGGAVFHVGPMRSGPPGHRTVAVESLPPALFPAIVSRAAVAAAMIGEAVDPRFTAQPKGVLPVPLLSVTPPPAARAPRWTSKPSSERR